MAVPHRLYFAGWSTTWGGAPAFVDPAVDATAGTLGAAWLLHRHQFEGLVAGENGGVPPTSGWDRPPLAPGETALVADGRYGLLVGCTSPDDRPALTVTAPVVPGLFGEPGAGYVDTIVTGLCEVHGIDEAAARAYVSARSPEPSSKLVADPELGEQVADGLECLAVVEHDPDVSADHQLAGDEGVERGTPAGCDGGCRLAVARQAHVGRHCGVGAGHDGEAAVIDHQAPRRARLHHLLDDHGDVREGVVRAHGPGSRSGGEGGEPFVGQELHVCNRGTGDPGHGSGQPPPKRTRPPRSSKRTPGAQAISHRLPSGSAT